MIYILIYNHIKQLYEIKLIQVHSVYLMCKKTYVQHTYLLKLYITYLMYMYVI